MKFTLSIIIALLIFSSCSRVDKSRFSKTKKNFIDSTDYFIDNEVKEIKVIDTTEVLRRNQQEGEYLFLLADSLNLDDLTYVPPNILRLMRNEIFAKKGYIFKSDDLKDYFNSTDWYYPLFYNVDSLLDLVDKHNISIIQTAEENNNEISMADLFEIYLSYVDNAPKALCFLFDCSKMRTEYADEYLGGFVKEYVLKSSKKSKYLLSGWFGGCSNCNYQYHLEKYDLEGNYLENIDLGISYEFEVKIDNYPDSIIIESYDREIKEEYSDSSEYIVQLEEEMYEDVSRFYNYETVITKVTLNKNDDVKIEQYTTGNTK